MYALRGRRGPRIGNHGGIFATANSTSCTPAVNGEGFDYQYARAIPATRDQRVVGLRFNSRNRELLLSIAGFQHERAGEGGAADHDGYGYRDMPVGVAHVGLDSSDQAVGYETDDPNEQAEAHASGGEEEGRKKYSRSGT